MRADDGHAYAVKLTSKPKGRRIVVNEYLAVRLARGLGLATPDAAIVQVANHNGDQAGVHFGSRFCKRRGNAFVEEWLPSAAWKFVANPADLVGAFVFDAWTSNTDYRQVIFARGPGLMPLRLYLIDNSHCFGCFNWRLLGTGTHCSPRLQFVYRDVTGWHDLEPWLRQIENLESSQVRRAAEGVPDEWLPGEEREAFEKLLDGLNNRRLETRALIAGAIESRLHPFSNWRIHSGLYVLPSRRAIGKTA